MSVWLAASAGMVFAWVACRPGRPRAFVAGGVAALAFVAVELQTTGAPILWCPALLPLPVALTVVATARVGEGGGAGAAWVAGAALGVAGSIHVGMLAWLPIVLAVVLACARAPLVSTLVALERQSG